ncbi:MAG: hypothetical protein ABI856_15050 [Nitrospira sp.]
MSDADLTPPVARPLPRFSALLCPAIDCDGVMAVEPTMKSLDGTGLESLTCAACGHRGFRSQGGIQTLFGGRHEHVCSYGPSLLTLTVVFSGAALRLFRDRGLNPTEAAVYAAHWTLLSGQVGGTVHLLSETPALTRCYEHFCRQMREAHTAGGQDAAERSWQRQG